MSQSKNKDKQNSVDTKQKADKTVHQLRRIRGQIDGIVRMYEDDTACIDVVRQVVAARNSLGRVARDLLSDEATKCSRTNDVSRLEIVLKELLR